MTTTTTNNAAKKETLKNNLVCVSCLAFFPLLYLIGTTIMSLVG